MEKLFANQLPKYGQYGENDNAQGHQGEVLLNHGDVAKEIATAHE